jgi:spore coat polysaccharide biosynthesis predicted glycosyltransferase SpsG
MSRHRVVFFCDAGISRGVGHVMRCVALAEEFAERGTEPVFVADVASTPWAARQITDRGFALHARPEGEAGLVAALLALRPDAIVLDSYVLCPEVTVGLRATGRPVLAIIDGDARGQVADLYLDQNLDAETDPWVGRDRLAGLRYVLLRDAVLKARPARPRTDAGLQVPRVFAYFGGTDPTGAAPALARCLAATGMPFDASFVAATPQIAAEIRAMTLARRQRITTTATVDDLPARAAAADVVLCASGTSVWDMMCVGAAAAVTWVADNQATGYARTVATGAVIGLGHVDALRAAPDAAASQVATLLGAPAIRSAIRATAWSLVNGDGRRLVADAVTTLMVRSDPTIVGSGSGIARSGPSIARSAPGIVRSDPS